MSFPILYDKMETEFGHLGLGVLIDATSCMVTEERNGIFELEMEYPISGAHFNLLENDCIIKVDAGHELKEQRFRIKRITKNMNGLVGIYAEHVSYLTQDLTLTPEIELRGNAQQALNQWKNNIIDENPFEVFSDIALVSETKLKIQDFDTARRVLGGIQGSVLEVWGGEYKFDNNRISLLENRGGNSNTLISYGRNLTDLDQEENIANTFTSVYPFAMYRDHSEDESSSDEQLITIDGYIVDSEHVNKYPNRRILPIDFSSEFESDVMPTQARLRALAEQYIQSHNVGVPKVSLNISFVDLTKSLDFNGLHYERVSLCDVVPIYFEKLGIRARAKINRIRWDVLLDQYESLEIGDARMTLSDKIREIEDDINNIGNRPPVIGGENIANISPQRVTNLEAKGAYGAINLFWDNQGLTVSHFELHRSMVSNFTPDEYTRIYRGRSNGFSDVVGTNRQYFYRCRAINYHGVAGEWSHEVMAQTAQIPFDDLEQEVKDGIENAINDANNAMQEAEDAKNVAQGAFDHAQNALENSNNALGVSNEAFDTAQGAFDSAQNALEGSKGAQEIADNARTEAKQARQDAETALEKSENAIVRVEGAEGNIAQITADVKGVGVAVGNLEGDITNLQVTASGLQTSISSVDGRVTSLSATVDGIETTVTDLSGNVSNLVQASDRLTIRISDTEDNISTLQQTSNSLATRITNAEDDISTVTQLATGLQTKVEDAEGNITTVTQLATGLQSKVEDAEGNITQLQTTANGLGIRISNNEENISNLNATAEYLHVRMEDAEDDISQIRLTADSLATRLENAEDDISTVTQLATGLQTTVTGPNGLQSQVTQLNNQFNITVGRIDDLETNVQSQFSVLENAINMRVQSGDVINQINISDESILIQGNKIHITGQTRIDDAVITDANIANATITSAKLKDVNADKITVGTLKGIRIDSVNINGSVITSEAGGSIVTMTQGQVTMNQTTGSNQSESVINPTQLRFRPRSSNLPLSGNIPNNLEVQYRPEGIYRRVGAAGQLTNFTHYINFTDGNEGIRVFGRMSIGLHGSADGSDVGLTLNNSRINAVSRLQFNHLTGPNTGLWFANTPTNQRWNMFNSNANGNAGHDWLHLSAFRPADAGGSVANAQLLSFKRSGQAGGTTYETDRASVRVGSGNGSVTTSTLWNDRAQLVITGQCFGIPRNGIGYNSMTAWVSSTGNLNVRQPGQTSGSFRPINASAFNVSSIRASKTHFKEMAELDETAVHLINRTNLYEYELVQEVEADIPHKSYGVVVEEAPIEIVNRTGEAVELYSMTTFSWKAIQELSEENKELKNRLERLEKLVDTLVGV